MIGQCAIWGTEASDVRSEGEKLFVVSPRAGGAYRISGTVQATGVPPELKARLTTWLIDRRLSGESAPFVTSAVLDTVKKAPRLKVNQKIDRFLLALAAVDYQPGQSFRLSGTVDDTYWKWLNLFCAWTENGDPKGSIDIFPLLLDLDYVTNANNPRLTAKGFQRLDSLTSGGVQFHQGFVAMWFGDDMVPVYDLGFEPAIIDAGYRAMRIDRKEHNNKIDDEIIAEIRRSRFLIADMTCPLIEGKDGKLNPSARGGVYYEAGFAQGLGIPVIWTARRDSIEHVHFDTRQYSHILWNDVEDLRKALKVRIGAVLGYGPGTMN